MKNKRETRVNFAPLEFRAAADDAEGTVGTLTGYAAVYGKRSKNLGGFVEVIERGAFASAFRDDADILALADHASAKRIGRTSNKSLRMFDDEEGLRVEIDLPDTTTGRDIAEEVRTGLVAGMSFGFMTRDDNWEKLSEPEADEAFPDFPIRAIRTLKDVELFEVSAVGNPAYADTSIAKRSFEAVDVTPPGPEDQTAANEETRAHMARRLKLAEI